MRQNTALCGNGLMALSSFFILFFLYRGRQCTYPCFLYWYSKQYSGSCEFNPWLRRLFSPPDFSPSPLQKHVRKLVSGIGKNSCVSTGVRKPGNTYASPTAMI